jgi:hypothetical protein
MQVDSNAISMLNIRLLEGNCNYCRKDSKEVAITLEAAKRIFGNESPVGKTISTTYPEEEEKVVCAVVKGWNGHSVLPFDILSPSLYDLRWTNQTGYTLIRIREGVDAKLFVQKLAGYEIDLAEEYYHQKGFIAKPLTNLRNENISLMEANVNPEYVRLFALTGGLVILCGLLNYLMLFIIRIRLRGRELALRKVNGASGASLMKLLITEFGLILILSLLAGMLPVELLLPKFKELSQINESSRFFYKETFVYALAVVSIAFLFSAFPVYYFRCKSLRASIYGSEGSKRSGDLFRKTALVFQLIICIGFVFCTVVIMKQLHYLRSTSDIGMERHNIGVVTDLKGMDLNYLAEKMKQLPQITDVLNGYPSMIPSLENMSIGLYSWEDKPEGFDRQVSLQIYGTGQEHADFYRFTLLQGSMFDKDNANEVLLNETAAKALGWDHPIGKYIQFGDDRKLIVTGILKDIRPRSPVSPSVPALFISNHDPNFKMGFEGFAFKFREGTWKECTAQIEALIKTENPDGFMQFYNVEEYYNRQYLNSEDTLMRLLGIVSLVCMGISAFGVFSLVTLACEQRRKEIAIRKVNGATAGNILRLFFKEYVLLLAIAAAVAFPIGYIIMKSWLEKYVLQTEIKAWIYMTITAGVAFIMAFCMARRVYLAARENPAETVKE